MQFLFGTSVNSVTIARIPTINFTQIALNPHLLIFQPHHCVPGPHLESARLRKLTIDSRRSTPTKSFQHPRRRRRMNHHRSQRHVCAAIGARPTVDPKAVPQQKREKAEWEAVRAGTQDFLHQNTYYISQDPDLFESLFGFPPTAP